VTQQIFFDLTELFTASSKFRYYGIARVVQEIALELHRIESDIRYVVYSPGHKRFFEVFPSFPENDAAANLVLGIEGHGSPIRIRQTYHSKNLPGMLLERIFSKFCQLIDLYRWRKAKIVLPEADLSGAVLVAAGRPKIIVEYLDALNQLQPAVRFMPLLHDMIPLTDYGKTRPRGFTVNFLHDNQKLISRAALVLCNSKFTKSEIERYEATGLLPKTPPIIPIQLAHQCRRGEEIAELQIPAEPYVLCVGSTIGRKNVECVFDALLELVKSGKPIPHLVLAGVYRGRIKKYLERDVYSSIRDHVLFFPNPNQTDLVRLYENALALILPSRLEGWGLPVGEALWLGTPALCADIPVLHEVASDLGKYFSPSDPLALSVHIDQIFTDVVFSKGLREKITQEKRSLRTWRDVAQDVLKAVSN
jgi:glycosyltransferase involved in cell wall biosynthesis